MVRQAPGEDLELSSGATTPFEDSGRATRIDRSFGEAVMATADLQAATAYLDCDMPQGELQEVAGGVAAVFSARLPGKSTANEDAAAVIPLDERSAVIVVADGLGGAASGDQASRLAVEALIRSVEHVGPDSEELRTAILNGFEQANRDVQTLGGGAATTLAVVEIHDGAVRPYHVGDSAILVTGQRGRVKLADRLPLAGGLCRRSRAAR